MLKRFFLLSRPRFWVYILGPYFLGALAASHQDIFTHPTFWIFFIYFTFPANLLIYGVNDFFDWETDKHNPKKRGYEVLLAPKERIKTVAWILGWNVPFWIMGLFLFDSLVLLWLFLFLFLGIQYSATPIRAKARPFLDSFFNGLYVMPGLLAFQLFASETAPVLLVLAAWAWTMAMHAYSAVPDIEADKRAHVSTIATSLGARGTLLFCAFLYGFAALVSGFWLGGLALILGAFYLLLMACSWWCKRKQRDLFKVYALFPWVNTFSGFLLACWMYLNLW